MFYNKNWSQEETLKYLKNVQIAMVIIFTLHVTIKGEVDLESGMVANFSDLKDIINKEVSEKIDHKFLNEDVKEFSEIVTTSENICLVIWGWLKPKLPNLYEIKLEETGNNSTIYRGD